MKLKLDVLHITDHTMKIFNMNGNAFPMKLANKLPISRNHYRMEKNLKARKDSNQASII